MADQDNQSDDKGPRKTLQARPKGDKLKMSGAAGRPAPQQAVSDDELDGPGPQRPPDDARSLKEIDSTETIATRLRATAERLVESYEIWRNPERQEDGRKEVNESLHELRRVIARIEINLAASRRDEQRKNPIPIPRHRASQS